MREGFEAECWRCGTVVHEGECVDPEGNNAAEDDPVDEAGV